MRSWFIYIAHSFNFWHLTKLCLTGAVQKSPSPSVKVKQGETSSPLSWTMKRFLEPASRVKELDAIKTASASHSAFTSALIWGSVLLPCHLRSVCFLHHVFKSWQQQTPLCMPIAFGSDVQSMGERAVGSPLLPPRGTPDLWEHTEEVSGRDLSLWAAGWVLGLFM